MDIPLIKGDSRLGGLQLYVDSANTGTVPIYISKNSGKGIQELTNIAIGKTSSPSRNRIIIAGGICDCTERNTDSSNPREKFVFNFDSVDSMTSYLYNLFTESYKQIIKAGLDIKDFRLPALGQVVLKADLPGHQFYLPDI